MSKKPPPREMKVKEPVEKHSGGPTPGTDTPNTAVFKAALSGMRASNARTEQSVPVEKLPDAQGLDTHYHKMSLRHVTLPSMNVIIASMPSAPVASLQYLTCFLETARKLKDEEKVRELQKQIDYIRMYLKKSSN